MPCRTKQGLTAAPASGAITPGGVKRGYLSATEPSSRMGERVEDLVDERVRGERALVQFDAQTRARPAR